MREKEKRRKQSRDILVLQVGPAKLTLQIHVLIPSDPGALGVP